MSPEQAVDTTKADERSDFFSLASVIFEMLTGQPRFPRGTFVETLKLIQTSRPDDFREKLAPFAPDGLISLLERMAANQPADRPASAEAILAEVDRLRLPCEKSLQGKPAEKQTEPQ